MSNIVGGKEIKGTNGEYIMAYAQQNDKKFV